MYSSEKVLQMCYATYQYVFFRGSGYRPLLIIEFERGKEALVEKFKNSSIMDEREEWRPKIYYSDGPKQGLPEPFPPPTHLRRKERSSHNRGALYVPGVHHYQQSSNPPPGLHRSSAGGSSGSSLWHHRSHPPRLSAPTPR